MKVDKYNNYRNIFGISLLLILVSFVNSREFIWIQIQTRLQPRITWEAFLKRPLLAPILEEGPSSQGDLQAATSVFAACSWIILDYIPFSELMFVSHEEPMVSCVWSAYSPVSTEKTAILADPAYAIFSTGTQQLSFSQNVSSIQTDLPLAPALERLWNSWGLQKRDRSFLLKVIRRPRKGGTFLLHCSLLTFSMLASSYPLKGSMVPVIALGPLGLFAPLFWCIHMSSRPFSWAQICVSDCCGTLLAAHRLSTSPFPASRLLPFWDSHCHEWIHQWLIVQARLQTPLWSVLPFRVYWAPPVYQTLGWVFTS